MTELYPDQELAVTHVEGDVADLRDNDTTGWYTSSGTAADMALRVGMDDPPADIADTQTVHFHLRKTSNGNNNPDALTELWESGSSVETLTAVTSIPSESGQTLTETFDAAAVADGTDVEFRVSGEATGGMPAGRDTIEVGYITWEATLDQFLGVQTLAPTDVTTDEATLRGEVDHAAYDQVDVWFEYREVGDATWNTTPTQTDVSPGVFTHVLAPLDDDTEYEYRAVADADSGTAADTGGIQTFWTTFIVGGVVDVGGSPAEGAKVYISHFTESELISDIYDEGTENVEFVVGHVVRTPVMEKRSDHLYILAENATGQEQGVWVTDEPLDMTGIDTVSVEWENTGADAIANTSVFAISTEQGGSFSTYDARILVQESFDRTTADVDVSSLEGDHYIRVHAIDLSAGAAQTCELLTYRISVDPPTGTPEIRFLETATTDSNGDYAVEVEGGREYHAAGQYGGVQDPHAGESYPQIRGSDNP